MAASFFPHHFQMCCGMFLAAAGTLHVFSTHGTELKPFHFCQHLVSDGFFRSLAATTRALHMHVFSAAAAETQELSEHKCVSLCLSCKFSFPPWLCVCFTPLPVLFLPPLAALPPCLFASLSSPTHLFPFAAL